MAKSHDDCTNKNDMEYWLISVSHDFCHTPWDLKKAALTLYGITVHCG